jgi:tetraprenyl-beta-curcumene synthase
VARRKLREERFNVELAATLATVARAARRGTVVRAIVALQVMYDYLDLLTEQPLADPVRDGHRLFGALVDALTPEPEPGEDREPGKDHELGMDHEPVDEREPGGAYYPGDRHSPRPRRADDGGYLRGLVVAARHALAQLPATAAVAEVARRSARRCAEAQVAGHAAGLTGTAELQRWARREAAGTGLQWPELLAGAAASVLAVHALAAAAADGRTTRADAERLDAVYLSIGALTMLDSLVDRDDDTGTDALGYAERYESRELMARRLAAVARDAADRARGLPNGAHHVMTMVGVVAYYTSARAADSAFALPVSAYMRGELQPLMAPTLALMRVWRLALRRR